MNTSNNNSTPSPSANQNEKETNIPYEILTIETADSLVNAEKKSKSKRNETNDNALDAHDNQDFYEEAVSEEDGSNINTHSDEDSKGSLTETERSFDGDDNDSSKKNRNSPIDDFKTYPPNDYELKNMPLNKFQQNLTNAAIKKI